MKLAAVAYLGFVSFCEAYDNGAPHSRLPTLGWSSWVALAPGADHPIFDFCDEFSIKSAADAFVEVGLYDAGYRHFHLDDCWAGGRNSTGYVYPEADHFPHGMKPVVDYVHEKGDSFALLKSFPPISSSLSCICSARPHLWLVHMRGYRDVCRGAPGKRWTLGAGRSNVCGMGGRLGEDGLV